jgi:hypothetical protein
MELLRVRALAWIKHALMALLYLKAVCGKDKAVPSCKVR